MKVALLAGILAITAPLCAQAPNPSQAPAGAAGTPSSSGTALEAELIRGVDARKAKPGDAVVARCQQDLKVNGEVLIPKGAKLIGHVAEAHIKGRGQAESTLGIIFDKAIMRDGRELPLTASIQALAPPAMLAADVSDSGFRIRSVPAAKSRTSALLPGALQTVRPPETSATGSTTLGTSSTGVVGVKDLQLDQVGAISSGGSVIHSSSQNIRLESGTRLILRVSLP